MSNQVFTMWVIIAFIFIGLCIFMVVRSLGKPVELPKPKPARKPVPSRRPRAEKQPRPASNDAPPSGRPLAPDDDIEFLRSLDNRPPTSDN